MIAIPTHGHGHLSFRPPELLPCPLQHKPCYAEQLLTKQHARRPGVHCGRMHTHAWRACPACYRNYNSWIVQPFPEERTTAIRYWRDKHPRCNGPPTQANTATVVKLPAPSRPEELLQRADAITHPHTPADPGTYTCIHMHTHASLHKPDTPATPRQGLVAVPPDSGILCLRTGPRKRPYRDQTTAVASTTYSRLYQNCTVHTPKWRAGTLTGAHPAAAAAESARRGAEAAQR